MNFLILAFVLLGNLWIWRIFSFSPLLGLIITVASIFLYLSIRKKNRSYSFVFLILLTFLLVFQWKTTSLKSLTLLSNDEQRVQAIRLKEYPAKRLGLGTWFEESPESIAFFRILKNFFEVVDPNIYFFANHPRERIGVVEFEKFPYTLVLFFLLGMFILIKRRYKNKLFFLGVAAPIILLSILGHDNPFGPFSLFPFIFIALAFGTESVHERIKGFPKLKKDILIVCFTLFYLLVLIQTFAYATI